MIIPLIILGLGAIFYGFLSRDLIIGLGSLYFNLVYTNFYNFNLFDSEFLPALVKNIPLIFTLLGAFSSLLLINCLSVNKSYIFDKKMEPGFRVIYKFLNKKWHFDQIVNELLAFRMMNFGYSTSFKTIDKGIIEQFGPSGLSFSIFNASFNILG